MFFFGNNESIIFPPFVFIQREKDFGRLKRNTN